MDTNESLRKKKLPYGTRVSVDGRPGKVIDDYGLEHINVIFDEDGRLLTVEFAKVVVL